MNNEINYQPQLVMRSSSINSNNYCKFQMCVSSFYLRSRWRDVRRHHSNNSPIFFLCKLHGFFSSWLKLKVPLELDQPYLQLTAKVPEHQLFSFRECTPHPETITNIKVKFGIPCHPKHVKHIMLGGEYRSKSYRSKPWNFHWITQFFLFRTLDFQKSLVILIQFEHS